MQRGFTKLFNTIVTSTIWQEDDKTRIVWITMLAIADAYGNVFAAIPGLASVAKVSIESCEKAVDSFLSPDKWSRTKQFEGKRIEEIDGGWHIINYGKYRKMMNEEERKEYKTQWARDKRRQKSTNVDKGRRRSTNVTQAEAEAEKKKIGAQARPTIEQVIELIGETAGRDFFDYYESNGWRVGRNPMKSWKAAAQRWKRNQSTVNPARPNFSRPKERAPSYPKMSETRECSDEERERVLAIAAEEKEKLRCKLNDHS